MHVSMSFEFNRFRMAGDWTEAVQALERSLRACEKVG